MILIDTNVFSETMKPMPDANVVDWLRSRAEQTLLSTIVIAEIRFGIGITKGAPLRGLLTRWLDRLIEAHSPDRVRDFDAKAALVWGEMLARFQLEGDYSGYRDSLLAAQAIAHGLPIATRNEKNFRIAGLELTNPWRS